MPQLGIALSTFFGTSYSDLTGLALKAEDTGFSGVFVTEGNNDVLMCCYAIARETRRIAIASWIANIYFREPVLCAAAAEMVQHESAGRFILGLGVSHRPALSALGIAMGDARAKLRRYTEIVREGLRGARIAPSAMRLRKASAPLPIYFGALVRETARLGAEIADGLMLYLASPERMRSIIAVAREEAARHGRDPGDVRVTMGLPVYLGDDRARALEAARKGLVFYVGLPFYNRILARCGFEAEAKGVAEAFARRDIKGAAAAVSDRLADAIALIGPASRCIARLNEYRASGAETPIIVPNIVSGDYASTVRGCIGAFSKSI